MKVHELMRILQCCDKDAEIEATYVDTLDIAQETLDVLNDPELMQQMADSEEDYNAGRCVTLRDLVAGLEE